jgi:hypothetical protein
LLLIFISCEKPSECIESTGSTVKKTFSVNPFARIKVYRGIAVVITQGTDYKVEVQSGSNIIDNIAVNQVDDQLIFKDNTTCNWLRAYGQTTVYITTPTLSEIYSKTDRDISSNGVLTYPVLNLFALDVDGDGEDAAGTGDFHLTINNSQLVIQNNNVSRYYISGTTTDAVLDFWAGDGRIEAGDLTAQTIEVYDRGSNDMIVKPMQSITGKMVSTGDIILKNNPPIVNVEQLYIGHVVYN